MSNEDVYTQLGGKSYLVEGADGQVYGPAKLSELRQWIQQGRVTAAMRLAYEDTDEWAPASSYAELATDFFGREAQALHALQRRNIPPMPTPPLADGSVSYQSQSAATRTNGMAVASLVCGICAFLVCPLVMGILAIVFGLNAKSQIASSRGMESGEGFATAGIVLGAISIPCGCIVFSALMQR